MASDAKTQRTKKLKQLLDSLYEQYHSRDYFKLDPIEFVYRYDDPLDQEVVALTAAVLAYGNVKQIRSSVQNVLTRMHSLANTPKEFVLNLNDPDFFIQAKLTFSSFVHRFNTGEDLIELYRLYAKTLTRFGSLGAHFLSFHETSATDFSAALSQLIREWKTESGLPRDSSFHYLLTSPESGSCCKRWCMFLLWMGRRDEIHPGLWTKGSALFTKQAYPTPENFLHSSQLVIPLDTHLGKITQKLKLTQRKSMNWKAATEVTERLREFDANDPVKYDFSLCRVGMLKLKI